MYISNKPTEKGRGIRTSYRVLKEKEKYSLVEIDLPTGRTHQIRAHMAHIGHPLAGDGKYGTNAVNKALPFSYQALYSYKLKFQFITEAGILTYLNGKEFTAKKPWLLEAISCIWNFLAKLFHILLTFCPLQYKLISADEK